MAPDDDSTRDSAPVRGSDPGSVSSPEDVDGQGTVGLQDRTAKGGQGSPDTNQAKTEPMPATPGEADPSAALEPPDLGSMNVGGADPQAPSHPLARERDTPVAAPVEQRYEPGVAPQDDRPALDTASTTKLPEGPERPQQASEGTAQRAPGSDGVSPEQQETDMEASAAAMRPGGGVGSMTPPVEAGDSQGVAVPHELPAAGTSEEAPIAAGARTPAAMDPDA